MMIMTTQAFKHRIHTTAFAQHLMNNLPEAPMIGSVCPTINNKNIITHGLSGSLATMACNMRAVYLPWRVTGAQRAAMKKNI